MWPRPPKPGPPRLTTAQVDARLAALTVTLRADRDRHDHDHAATVLDRIDALLEQRREMTEEVTT